MRGRYIPRRTTAVSVGWLFADLLLVLAMLFLVANTITTVKPKPTPTPIAGITPTPTPSPTPTPVLRLETTYQQFAITIDYNGLLANSQSAINNAKQQIQAQQLLNGRNVGLAIVYGGAPTQGDIGTAQNIARKIYDVLRTLGKEGFAFTKASYYDPLYVLGSNLQSVVIDVYLFIKT